MKRLDLPLPTGHAHVERVRTGWAVDVEGTSTVEATRAGIKAALAAVADAGGGLARLWARGGAPHVAAAARDLGFVAERQLLQLRRPLPLEPPYDLGPGSPYLVDTRAFVPGEDEVAWLAVNNRAFDWHPEQGGMTLADVEAREAEPWFDPAGFLLHEVEGEVVAFCWTKRHLDETPPLGEIYAIAVDPAAHVQGLGKPMVLAGLDHLHRVDGLDWGMLYVDGGNDGARAMYDALGFTTARVDESFVLEVPGS